MRKLLLSLSFILGLTSASDARVIAIMIPSSSIANPVSLTNSDGTVTLSPITITQTGTISCTKATTSQLGCIKPDGTSLSISAGVVSIATGGVTNAMLAGSIATSKLANTQGNGLLIQRTLGTTTNGDIPEYDSYGNIIDSTVALSSLVTTTTLNNDTLPASVTCLGVGTACGSAGTITTTGAIASGNFITATNNINTNNSFNVNSTTGYLGLDYGNSKISSTTAGSVFLGGAASATPVSYIFRIGEPGSGTNIAAGNGEIDLPVGTGTGALPTYKFRAPTSLQGSGTTAQTLATIWDWNATNAGAVTFSVPVDAATFNAGTNIVSTPLSTAGTCTSGATEVVNDGGTFAAKVYGAAYTAADGTTQRRISCLSSAWVYN